MKIARFAKNRQQEFSLDISAETSLPMLRCVSNAQKKLWAVMYLPIQPEAHANNHRMANGVIFSPKEKKDYMRRVTWQASSLWEKKGLKMIEFPIFLDWVFLLKRPKSIQGHTYEYKFTQPDVDGYVKTTKDCLQARNLFKAGPSKFFVGACIIKNDSLVVKESSEKAYAKNRTTGIFIQIRDASIEDNKPPSWACALYGKDP